MVKQMLHKFLSTFSGSQEQKQCLMRLLYSIKDDEDLLKAFLQQELTTSLDDDVPNNVETFFGTEIILNQFATTVNEPKGFPQESQSFWNSQNDVTSDIEHKQIQTKVPIMPARLKNDSLDEALNIKTLSPEDSAAQLPEQTTSSLGRYIDLGLLGQGGMGEVRKVRDKILNRNLAMKIINPRFISSNNAITRFMEEAQVGAQLQHANIVPVHEFGRLPDGRYYFTMQEIKGREFSELINSVHSISTATLWNSSNDGVTFRTLIQVFHKVCETIAFSHSLGVVHRDLKPENVMIGDYGEVLVVDWGIAKVLGSSESNVEVVETDRSEQNIMATQMGMIAGTPAYMAPEQAMGRVDLIGPHTDIYTLGAILYEILSGRRPYSGRTANEIVDKVKTSRPPSLMTMTYQDIENIEEVETAITREAIPLNEDTGKIPTPLIIICEQAMQRKINDRYTSVASLAKDVSDWLEGAQKRDRALVEFDVAMEKLAKANQIDVSYSQSWKKANASIEKNGFDEDSSWIYWEEADNFRRQSVQLRKEYRQTLHDSLVYDPSLVEANEAMASLLLSDIILSVATGEKQKIDIIERQFNGLLQHLSEAKQKVFQSDLQRKRKDYIVLLRARSGSLVGRQDLRKEITKALQKESRLISLVGTPGVGKTRLALETIYDLQQPNTNTYFCDVTEADSELGIARFVAKAMNVKLRNIDPIGQLGELFAQQSTILVVDNLEQVIAAAGTVIARWMKQSDTLKIIATSRIKLRIANELSFAVQPLSILEGMEVFSKRGKQAEGTFCLSKNTRQVVGRLVTQLDKLPLAIELAAARLNIFSVTEIEQRLKQRFSLLRSRDKGTQALQGALDWSWDLLDPWAKAVLSQSSIFHGGFEIKAANDILMVGTWNNTPTVTNILQALFEDSLLLLTKSEEGAVRYGLLESIRQYARSKLNDEESITQDLSGPNASKQTEHRHANHYSKFGEKKFLESMESQGEQSQWILFSEELDNFVAGSEYGSGDNAIKCCLAAMKILGMKGPVSMGVDVAAEVVTKPDISQRSRKQLQIIRSRFLRISGRMNEAREENSRQRKRRTRFRNTTPNPKLSSILKPEDKE
jgi:serine/threonine protein kinase/predicted ATPase